MGTLNIRCRTILGTQKGTIILTTTQVLIIVTVVVGFFPDFHGSGPGLGNWYLVPATQVSTKGKLGSTTGQGSLRLVRLSIGVLLCRGAGLGFKVTSCEA